MNKLIKNTALIFLLGASGLCAMEKNKIFELAYQCNAQSLEGLITPDSINSYDERGTSLVAHAISGAFRHKRYDDFENVIVLFQNNNMDFNAPVRAGSELSNLGFLANIAISNKNLIPLHIALKKGANPFNTNDNVFEKILARALNQEPSAAPVVRAMAYYAKTLHDAAKGVCVESITKYANIQSVQTIDSKGNTPLFYLITSSRLGSKQQLCAALKLLKKQGVDVNSPIPNVEKKGFTYMHYATSVSQLNENTTIVEAMLKHGGSPHAGKGDSLMTPKQVAKYMAFILPFYKKISVIFNAHLLKNNTSQNAV